MRSLPWTRVVIASFAIALSAGIEAQTYSVAVTPSSASRSPAQSIQFAMMVTQPDGVVIRRNAFATWSSSVPSVAVVDNSGTSTAGTVDPVAEGTTVITAVMKNADGVTRSASATLVVRDFQVAIVPAMTYAAPGGMAQPLAYRVTRPDGTTVTANASVVQWSSSNPDVARMMSDGRVVAMIAPGKVTITGLFQTADGVMRKAYSTVETKEGIK